MGPSAVHGVFSSAHVHLAVLSPVHSAVHVAAFFPQRVRSGHVHDVLDVPSSAWT